jgi:hypothetical protein
MKAAITAIPSTTNTAQASRGMRRQAQSRSAPSDFNVSQPAPSRA